MEKDTTLTNTLYQTDSKDTKRCNLAKNTCNQDKTCSQDIKMNDPAEQGSSAKCLDDNEGQ